jgi:hypothetical protein
MTPKTTRASRGVVDIFTGDNGEIIIDAKGKVRERG